MPRALGLALCVIACVGAPPQPCTQCGGQCVDLNSDSANCGNCGNTCNAMQFCKAGSCHSVDCPTGETRCGDLCVDLLSNAANCGGCGAPCASGQLCQMGNCVSSCAAPLLSCSMACVDPANDPKNCGGCGVHCAPDHVVAAACVNKGCSYAQCLDAYADCDGTPQNGCETEVDVDVRNCGGCGRRCTPLHVAAMLPDGGLDEGDGGQPARGATCSNGTCGYQQCAPGWLDCDGARENGCETADLDGGC